MADHVGYLIAELQNEIKEREVKLEGLRRLFPENFKNGSGNGRVAASNLDDLEDWGAKKPRKSGRNVPRFRGKGNTRGGPSKATMAMRGSFNVPGPEVQRLPGTKAVSLILGLNNDRWMSVSDISLIMVDLGWWPNYQKASNNIRSAIQHMERVNRVKSRKVDPEELRGVGFEYQLKGTSGKAKEVPGLVKAIGESERGETVDLGTFSRPLTQAEVSGVEVVGSPDVGYTAPPTVNPDTYQQGQYYSYLEYLTEAGIVAGQHPDWRIGQVFFNTLYQKKPIMANMVRGTGLDPFHSYSKHDPSVERFLTWVERNWDLEGRDLEIANPALMPKSD